MSDEALRLNLRGMGYDDGLKALLSALSSPHRIPTEQLTDDVGEMEGYVMAAIARGPEKGEMVALGQLLVDLGHARVALLALESAQNALARLPRLEAVVEAASFAHNDAGVQQALAAYEVKP